MIPRRTDPDRGSKDGWDGYGRGISPRNPRFRWIPNADPRHRKRYMIFDCHLHSTHSADAESPIHDMCRSAVQKGLSVVCFTEHYDLDPMDSKYDRYDYERHRADIDRAKAAFDGRLEVLYGIEFSEPHRYPKEFEETAGRGFDFILGSMHSIGGTWAGAVDILTRFSPEQIFDLHYTETLNMVRFGGFDALAHIDFPRRFIAEYREPRDLIDPILDALVRSGIALELNSSPLRHGKDFSLPSPAILRRYRELGGLFVTAGSDSHRAGDVGSGLEHLAAQIRAHGLQPVIYRARKRCPVDPG
jgi:histidinol-phosphatase (PHP family)